MVYETLLVAQAGGSLRVTLNRPARRNSLNSRLITELNQVLSQAEADPQCRVVVLEGQQGVFCTGMDFEEVVTGDGDGAGSRQLTQQYMATLRRLSLSPKVIVTKVEGQVLAGGVGLVAASDIAVAAPSAQFGLSEALWGLLPSMVLPYLIRRVGFQKAYFMTMTTLSLTAAEAQACGLVDMVDEEPEGAIMRLSSRLVRLDEETVMDMKRYFRKLWMITDETEQMAAAETARLVSSQRVRTNLENFVKYRQFPWETRKQP